jgi:hypothetical protein
MDIDPDANDVASAWKRLHVLPGANLLAGVKPAAEILAATADGRPLIVAQTYGAGRSLAIAFDTTWLWVTTADTGDLQRRFWRQVAMFLCAPKGNAWISSDKPAYDLHRLAAGQDQVTVTAGVEDLRGVPLREGPVTITLTAPGGNVTPLRLALEKDRRVGRLPPRWVAQAGTYALKIEAEVAGSGLSAEYRFDVQSRNLEAMEVLANLDLLKRLAEATGGRHVRLASLSDLIKHLRVSSRPAIRSSLEQLDLGAHLRWPMVAVLIAMFCIEWAVRKRKGLV